MEMHNKKPSNIFLKYIYDYCIGVEYNKSQLMSLAKRFDTSVLQIREWALKYVKENFSEEEYNDIVEKIKKIITDNRNPWDMYPIWNKKIMMKYAYENCERFEWKSEQLELFSKRIAIEKTKLKKLALTYVERNFSEKERENIIKHINELIELDKLNTMLEIKCINPILYQITDKITNRLWETDEDKKVVLECIYNYCEDNDYHKDKINAISNALGISEIKVKEYAKEYATKYLGIALEEYSEKLTKYKNKRLEEKHEQRRLEKVNINRTNPILQKLTGKVTNLLWENQGERSIVLKYIYEYCMDTEWKTIPLNELAKELGISRQQIRILARMHAKENFSEEEYKKINKLINEITNQNRSIELSNENLILKKLTGKVTYLLWENEDDKTIVLKYVYDYCEENKYSEDKIEELSEWSGLSKNRIKDFSEEYATKYLGIDLEEYRKKKNQYIKIRLENIQKNKPSYYSEINSKILKATTLEELIEIISNPDININSLISSISNYVIIKHNGDETVKKILKTKIKMYTDYVSQEKKIEKNKQLEEEKLKALEKKLPIAIEIITKFINDTESDTTDYFCYKNNLDKNFFEECIVIIKVHKKDLYEIYIKRINELKKNHYSLLKERIKNIIEHLKYGIEENEINRPFDLLDYFEITRISFDEMLKFAKENFSPSEVNLLKKFVNQNINGTKHNPNIIKQIMEERVIIRYEKDRKGQPIPGTEEIFNNEEKERLINYLKEKKIPINPKTYNLAYRRYKNGTLRLNNSIKKK